MQSVWPITVVLNSHIRIVLDTLDVSISRLYCSSSLTAFECFNLVSALCCSHVFHPCYLKFVNICEFKETLKTDCSYMMSAYDIL